MSIRWMRKAFMLFLLLVTCAGMVGCEEAFKDVKLPSLADAPEKLGAPKQ